MDCDGVVNEEDNDVDGDEVYARDEDVNQLDCDDTNAELDYKH